MLDELKKQRDAIVMQRAAAKDQVEQAERALGQIGFAIQALEAEAKARAEAEATPDSE